MLGGENSFPFTVLHRVFVGWYEWVLHLESTVLTCIADYCSLAKTTSFTNEWSLLLEGKLLQTMRSVFIIACPRFLMLP